MPSTSQNVECIYIQNPGENGAPTNANATNDTFPLDMDLAGIEIDSPSRFRGLKIGGLTNKITDALKRGEGYQNWGKVLSGLANYYTYWAEVKPFGQADWAYIAQAMVAKYPCLQRKNGKYDWVRLFYARRIICTPRWKYSNLPKS
jgi:hypothetical protein